ncbi:MULTISPECIES: hypothetical protein [Streptomyces]|uniref:Uncharacterized protein n=1 Tax=Streptomyces drozdowiczii TaxID=202862 RepID=A0ABY6PMW5_9ACTN|nr:MULTISPECIES: hypothetical protein [Streptomyces]MCX0247029.1 hypothetical protein [Streptomyces drozdowiczii]OKJ75067.1 hypothetical protein AMK30_12515 [Streptomyces sp. CB02460]UZK53533.1 hypothetical protein NEH16_04700 [Streptomyces drozdowiczii]
MRISASVRARSVRAGTVAAAVVAAAAATLGGASAAFAAPGDSGDIDIRPGGWAARGGDGNEVCKFVLQASNFGDMPAVPWTITAQPPTVPPGDTLASTLPLVNGSARSQEYLLPEGTYQLVWIVPAGPKNKAFKVDCTKPAGHNGSGNNAERGSAESGSESGYEQPSGGVPAGGGGVPDMEGVSSESDSNVGTTAALAAGAVGAAGLIMVRRAARRRARNEA